jgi:UDP-N-acetylglucosamine--N-acetylmuramyl-(pentapeptide) pyrophosphoryl-undecaprenol N-acetylglucosamine transferase
MINRIVFAAGGTGGHIYPAIAIADELMKMNPGTEIKFIGAKNRIEEKIIPKNGYDLETIEVSGFKRSFSLKNVSTAYKIIKAIKDAKQILKQFNPEIVYGTGGYVSGPVLRAAGKLGIMNVIEEGNFYPGVTVKLVSSKATKVLLNFEGTRKYLKRQDNIEVMPYPVRQNLKKYDRSTAAKYFGLSAEKKTLFVFGGSQGAHSVNVALLNCYKKLLTAGIQIIWQTGSSDFDSINGTVSSEESIKALSYIDKIDYAYSACDLVLCRSGISTIMELASFGLAAVFAPFPLASENHQEMNARAITEKQAAGLILDSELNEKLERVLIELLSDDEKLENYRKNIKQFADTEAASKIAIMLSEMVNRSKIL